MVADLRTAIVQGRTVRYLDSAASGRRGALVLLHAFPVGVHMWEAQLHALSDWRIVAPALPGFDGSDLLADASMDGYARQVLSLLDELGIERAVWAGLSMGAYVAFGVMRHARERVTGLTLADTRSTADTDTARAARRALLDVLDREGVDGVAADMIPKLLGRTTQDRQPEIAERVRGWIARQVSTGMRAATIAMMNRPDSTAMLGTVRIPVLVIVGDEDTLTPPEEAERLRASIPGAALTRVSAAGHLSSVENPEAFTVALTQWLNTV